MKLRAFFTLFLGIAAAIPAFAESSDEMTEVGGKQPVLLRPDRAYFLFRSSDGISPVFLRVPSEAELLAYDMAKRAAFDEAEPELIEKRENAIARKNTAEQNGRSTDVGIPPVPTLENFNFAYSEIRNAQTVDMGRAFEKSGKEKNFLIEALPGAYVLYGLGGGDFFLTCFCLGTVSFTGKGGQITDLGTLLAAPAANKSNIPELAGETGLGPSMNGHVVTWAAAIRPASPSTRVPSLLSGTTVTPADYRATGKFVAGFSFSVNRLAPIPGVLGYEKGNVLDLANNTVAPNQY